MSPDPIPATAPAAPPIVPPLVPDAETPALPPRRRRRRTGRWLALGLSLAGVGLAVAGARGHLAGTILGGAPTPFATGRVLKTPMRVAISAPGSVQSSNSKDVRSEVEGQTTIVSLKVDGTQVKKGDLVCELDGSALRDQLTNQIITTRQAESTLQNATKNLEVAKMTLNEYLVGTFPRTMSDYKSNLVLAETNLQQAVEKFLWSRDMVSRNLLPETTNKADGNGKLNAEIKVSSARNQMRVLETFTRQKQLITLQAAIDKGTIDVEASRAGLERERQKLAKLERLVASCKLYAPGDGLVVYGKEDGGGRPGQEAKIIQEGASVRERQKIFSIPDFARMRVDTKVHETEISLIQPGQEARITIDAIGSAPLIGKVASVRPLPELVETPGGTNRYHTVVITIENPPAAIRPEMTAKVDIIASETAEVLTMPLEAVMPLRDITYVMVATPGGHERREVKLGRSDERRIEVLAGLKDGDLVALDPEALLTQAERAEIFAASIANTRNDWGPAPARLPVPPAAAAAATSPGASTESAKPAP